MQSHLYHLILRGRTLNCVAPTLLVTLLLVSPESQTEHAAPGSPETEPTQQVLTQGKVHTAQQQMRVSSQLWTECHTPPQFLFCLFRKLQCQDLVG